MRGFDDAIDGQYDVADQLSRYLLDRARTLTGSDRPLTADFDSQDAFEAHRERVRSTFLTVIGGLPDRPADLTVETTGRRQRAGYSVERVIFESRPDVHVTANCYVPDGDGPHPGVLFLCGHLDAPKADPANQRACIELALNGFVVLVVDPVGQGERTQYDDVDLPGTVLSGGGGVFAHAYAGQKCFYAGGNLARHMLADDRCALDYLIGRDDVDSDRIGVTGTSGGGTQTLYLGLVDDRVDVAAPCCAVSRRYEQLKTGNRPHAEQAITGSVAQGLDYHDFLAAMAPRPICVGAAAADQYFPIEGVHDTVEEVRRTYGLFDAAERVTFVVADEPHCSVYELGGVLPWLGEQLGDGGYESSDDLATLDGADLRCTPAGSVHEAYPDERTIDDLIQDSIASWFPDAGTSSAVDGGTVDPSELRQRLTDRFEFDRRRCELSPRFVGRTTENGLEIEHVWFKTEHEPDIAVTGVLVSDPDSATDSPAVVLYEAGTEALPERSEAVASLVEEHGAVLVFDPRGVGAVRNREIPVPNWADDYFGIYGTEFKLANDALLLGSSLFGMRVYDVARAVELLRSETGSTSVSFVGEGIGAYHALYAAAVARDVDRVTVSDLGPSFAELATTRDSPFDPRLTAFDMIEACDLPDLRAALEQRGVQVETQRSEQ